MSEPPLTTTTLPRWTQIRSALSHAGLLITLMAYTAVGGIVSTNILILLHMLYSFFFISDW